MEHSLFRAILVCFSIIYNFVQPYELEIDQRDLFPYPAHKIFSIIIIPRDKVLLYKSMVDTMVIVIRNATTQKEMERAIFDYGFKEMIDQPYKGSYLNIPVWYRELKHGREQMNVSIIFSRLANDHLLQVYQVEADSGGERRQKMNNLQIEAKMLLEEKISLLIPPKIDLAITSRHSRNNEVMLGEVATAKCRSYEGIPTIDPIFLDLSELTVINTNFDFAKNERQVQFKVSLFDHEKKLRCKSGETFDEAVILVLHHPSQVTLDPEPSDLLENGSSIVCLKADGYPSPFIRWTFISGPPNASRYYNITDAGTRFNLHNNAPLHGRWTLNCTSSNIIPGSAAHYNRTITFTVGRPQEGLFERLNLTTQLIIGVVVVAAIVLFCIMIVIIICIVRRCCVSPPVNSGRKNGGPVKASSKEKGLEAEQVTLLPPGAPPNYIDLSNSGTGLPPPPPEYELMITDDPKCALSTEIHQENEGSLKYNEGPVKYKDGSIKYKDGSVKYKDGSVKYKDGSVKYKDGSVKYGDGSLKYGDGSMKYGDGSMKYGDGSLKYDEVTYAELNTSNLPMKNNVSPQASSCSDDQVIYSQIVGTVSNPYSTQRSYTEPNNV